MRPYEVMGIPYLESGENSTSPHVHNYFNTCLGVNHISFNNIFCRNDVKGGLDPHSTPNADGGGVRGAESNMGVGFRRGAHGGMRMDAGMLPVP